MICSGTQKLTTFLCSVITIVIVDIANAEMCKWVGEDGCVHYAETCPESVEGIEIEIQQPPSQAQIDNASRRYTDDELQQGDQKELPSESLELSSVNIDQMRDRCVDARLSLDTLSQDLPVYYDKLGKLQAESHKSVRFEFDRSGSYLSADAKKRAYEHWRLVKQDNCTSEVLGSGIKSEMKRRRKEHQQRECEWWKSELEFMGRNKSFHKERMDLKKQFNAKCK
jgi:hypothetical protein